MITHDKTKVYTVNVLLLDCNGHPVNDVTYTFLSEDDKDEFIYALEHYQDLDEVNFEYKEDEYFTCSLDGAKTEVKKFLGLTDY